VTGVAVLLVAGVVAFFRDPHRVTPQDENTVFAPCDGCVVMVEKVRPKEYFEGRECLQVSVFMSLTNVHANFFPVGGRVVYYKYHPGKFLVAWHPKSSELNEHTTTVVETPHGEVLVRQIAGLVARRIVCYAEEGAQVGQNSRLGFIKFGSRMDVLLPPDAEVTVRVGDKVRGRITPLAKF
jgi:phosphatidylserine decarboxylase